MLPESEQHEVVEIIEPQHISAELIFSLAAFLFAVVMWLNIDNELRHIDGASIFRQPGLWSLTAIYGMLGFGVFNLVTCVRRNFNSDVGASMVPELFFWVKSIEYVGSERPCDGFPYSVLAATDQGHHYPEQVFGNDYPDPVVRWCLCAAQFCDRLCDCCGIWHSRYDPEAFELTDRPDHSWYGSWGHYGSQTTCRRRKYGKPSGFGKPPDISGHFWHDCVSDRATSGFPFPPQKRTLTTSMKITRLKLLFRASFYARDQTTK